MVKNPPANVGVTRDVGLIPGCTRYPGEGHGNPLQYSCLENAMDREEPGGLQSMGLQRAGHNCGDSTQHTGGTGDRQAGRSFYSGWRSRGLCSLRRLGSKCQGPHQSLPAPLTCSCPGISNNHFQPLSPVLVWASPTITSSPSHPVLVLAPITSIPSHLFLSWHLQQSLPAFHPALVLVPITSSPSHLFLSWHLQQSNLKNPDTSGEK